MQRFPYKQVHLDFHTSPDIPGIGSRFDKAQFQEALKKGHLDSITVFAKCHHGVCYYPTEVGTMHPELDFDLTGAMVDAAHEIGVRAPIYITAGWSELDAVQHPEWISVDAAGMRIGSRKNHLTLGFNQPLPHSSWDTLCLNDGSPYCDHIYALTEEICKRYPTVDGLFFDICIVNSECYCENCMKGMAAMGLDPSKLSDAQKYFTAKRRAFMEKCNAILQQYHPGATIFFNSGGATIKRAQYHDLQTHYEMEDLPTAWGGYDKLPLRARYFAHYGKPYLGMTGKFHLSWGEFGGFKCKEALKFEVSTMALYGAGCSVGDHAHPDCEMEMQTYENIGYAYEYLEKIAPYCYGGEITARLGLVLSPNNNANEGISKILLENQIEYDLVHHNNFAPFETVIIPEGIVADDAMLQALNAYLANGGKVLFCGDALVKDGHFQIDCGAAYTGKPEFDCDYIFTDRPYRMELPNAPMLCNLPGQKVQITDGEEVASILVPYFSRTRAHFCGHKNTPYNKNAQTLPGIVKKGNVVYMAHPMASAYFEYGSLYQKRYLMLALEQLFAGGAFRISGLGSLGRATMIRQPEQNRYCLNMVYASPIRRGCADVIEDINPIYDIRIALDIPETVKRAYLPLTGEELPVTSENGLQALTVPKLECHTSVVLEY